MLFRLFYKIFEIFEIFEIFKIFEIFEIPFIKSVIYKRKSVDFQKKEIVAIPLELAPRVVVG